MTIAKGKGFDKVLLYEGCYAGQIVAPAQKMAGPVRRRSYGQPHLAH